MSALTSPIDSRSIDHGCNENARNVRMYVDDLSQRLNAVTRRIFGLAIAARPRRIAIDNANNRTVPTIRNGNRTPIRGHVKSSNNQRQSWANLAQPMASSLWRVLNATHVASFDRSHVPLADAIATSFVRSFVCHNNGRSVEYYRAAIVL